MQLSGTKTESWVVNFLFFIQYFFIFSKAARKKSLKKAIFLRNFPFKYQNVAIDLDTFLQLLARFLESVWVKLHEIFVIAFGLLIKCDKLKIFQICQGANFLKNMGQFFHEKDFSDKAYFDIKLMKTEPFLC